MRKKQLLGGVLEEVRLPNNTAYYARLHDRIMARVEETEMEVAERPAMRSFDTMPRLLRDHWKGWQQSNEKE